MKGMIRVVTGMILLGVAGCASAPVEPPLSAEEQFRQDVSKGGELAEDLESRLTLKRDVEVSVYLRRLAQKLAGTQPNLRDAPIGVLTYVDKNGKWGTFSLPGNRIYVSVGLLRSLEFENELAAALAYELAHIVNRHALTRLERASVVGTSPSPSKIEFFGSIGIFSYGEKQYLDSAEIAVDILYKAGFDPRGLTALWIRYQDNPKRAPYGAPTLAKLLEQTRNVVALYTPLRNPVVRSDAFLAIRRRIDRL